jgi:hypothetical protein
MKADRITKVLLCIIAVLLLLNLAHSLLTSRSAMAVNGNGEIGRYQIGAWATQSAGAVVSHTGYYILDTATGKVVASKSEEYRPPGR